MVLSLLVQFVQTSPFCKINKNGRTWTGRRRIEVILIDCVVQAAGVKARQMGVQN